MIRLHPCPKSAASDLGKSRSPAETVRAVRERLEKLEAQGCHILAETRRVDVGRLGIPVYMSLCGDTARRFLPTRKQMGKGATKEQAEASALMELMERFGFFTFRAKEPLARLGWKDAEKRFGRDLIPVDDILRSVHDALPPDKARDALDTVVWDFVPATDILNEREIILPINWFYALGEFNGSSAGNTAEESILQGACELVERHVCGRVDRERPELPTIRQDSLENPVLADLLRRFREQGIILVLKDLSLGQPLPTVGALAWDPATFPAKSEVVFTAGTASSPAGAAIRAVTEVAQLGGDFITGSCYEASGLPKFTHPDEAAWLLAGPEVSLDTLPSLEHPDLRDELLTLARGLRDAGNPLYVLDTTNAETGIPTHYCIAPGLAFRERDRNASLGLFIGRLLAEQEEDPAKSAHGLAVLDELYPGAHWSPFFQGMLALRTGDLAAAVALFARALPLQPDDEARALAAFYLAHTLTLGEKWDEAVPYLDTAIAHSPGVKEYYNLRGVCRFKTGAYREAGGDFLHVVTHLDKGSVMDIANLGFCHERMGNTQEAVLWLQRALALDPGFDKVRQSLEKLLAR